MIGRPGRDRDSRSVGARNVRPPGLAACPRETLAPATGLAAPIPPSPPVWQNR